MGKTFMTIAARKLRSVKPAVFVLDSRSCKSPQLTDTMHLSSSIVFGSSSWGADAGQASSNGFGSCAGLDPGWLARRGEQIPNEIRQVRPGRHSPWKGREVSPEANSKCLEGVFAGPPLPHHFIVGSRVFCKKHEDFPPTRGPSLGLRCVG